MKKVFLSMFVALLAVVTMSAQQIAVVKGSTTSVYQTLAEAIDGAESGSFIYLPGGSFPLSDEVKITKLLYIMGIGHDAQSDNADGRTLISGQLCFEGGSDGSLVMGCYITGNVNIGTAETPVHQIVVKYCNLNSIQVNHADCLGTVVNQNYLRSPSNCNYASVDFTNNLMHSIIQVGGGYICFNILVHNYEVHWQYALPLYKVNNAIIKDNIILASYDTWDIYEGNDSQIIGNMSNQNWGENCINVQANWADVLLNPEGITPASNYHFKETYKEYENKVGIYAGSGFSDSGLPPVPYITEKDIPGQTDASGKLNIKIKVKAGE